VLDLHYRRRRGTTQISVRRGSGPPIVVDCDVSDPAPAAAELDGIAMGSTRLRFEASGDHEILLHAGD